jgi:exodeoxyribonuclease VII large subunit
VVSAVGHETDFTIADFAADLRAPTPSAAAELVTPDFEDVSSEIANFKYNLSHSVRRRLNECALRLDAAVSSKAMREPLNAILAHRRSFELLCVALSSKTENRLMLEKNRLAAMASKLDALSPLKVLTRGYSIASGENGVISSAENLRRVNKFTLRMSDGEVKCGVLNTSESLDENR